MSCSENFITSLSVKLVFYGFIIFSIISSCICIFDGYYGGDLVPLNEPYNNEYIYFFIYYIISLIIFYIIYKLLIKINIKNKIKRINYAAVDKIVHILFLFIVIFFIFTVTMTSVGTISREESGSRIIELIYALIQPNYLTIVYIIYYKSSNYFIYKFNIILFILALFFTGFTGYILFFIPFIVFWSIKSFGKFRTLLIIICAFCFLPFLRILKFKFQQQLSIAEIYEKVDIDFFISMVRIVIDRFNYVPNILYIENSKNYLNLDAHEYAPYYQGYFGSLLHKIIYGNLNSELTYLITGFRDSNSTFPLISYFAFDISVGLLIFLYSFVIYFLLYIFMQYFIKDNYYFRYIFFIFGYLYLLQGWFWPFMNFFQAVILYLLLMLFINYIKVSLISKKRKSYV